MPLYTLNVTESGKLPIFLAAMGFVYVRIGVVLIFIDDRHMTRRMRAGENE